MGLISHQKKPLRHHERETKRRCPSTESEQARIERSGPKAYTSTPNGAASRQDHNNEKEDEKDEKDEK
jgi:hypothetical protein